MKLLPMRNFLFLSSFDNIGVKALKRLLHRVFTAQMHLGIAANGKKEIYLSEAGALNSLMLLFAVLTGYRPPKVDLSGNSLYNSWRSVEHDVNAVLESWPWSMSLPYRLHSTAPLKLGYALLRWGRLFAENSARKAMSTESGHILPKQSYTQLEMHLGE